MEMKKTTSGESVNVANVTRELLDLTMKLPEGERLKLFKKLKPDAATEPGPKAKATITTGLIDAIMKLGIQERCRILEDLKATSGSSKRKHSRVDFFSPIEYVVDGRMSSGFIKDASATGIFIEDPHYTGPALKPGQTVTMIFNHPHTGDHTKVTGKIARITKKGLGVHFNDTI